MAPSLIVAVAEGGVIGREGKLPWHLPADLARFKRLTMGHHILMGRRTWESIGRPLPGRTTVIISRRGVPGAPEGVHVASSLEAALALAGDDPEPFVIGGGMIYREALPLARRVYLTRVHGTFPGDTYFPDLDPGAWRLVEREEHPADARNRHACSFLVYERRPAPR